MKTILWLIWIQLTFVSNTHASWSESNYNLVAFVLVMCFFTDVYGWLDKHLIGRNKK